MGLVRFDLLEGWGSLCSQSRAEFKAKWGIQSDQELRDIITVLQAVTRSQFQRLRPKWRREFGEETLQAIENMSTYYPSSSTTPIARMLTGHQDQVCSYSSSLVLSGVSRLFDRNDRSTLQPRTLPGSPHGSGPCHTDPRRFPSWDPLPRLGLELEPSCAFASFQEK